MIVITTKASLLIMWPVGSTFGEIWFEVESIETCRVSGYKGTLCNVGNTYLSVYFLWLTILDFSQKRADTELFGIRMVNIMVVDVLTPCVAWTSATMILTNEFG